MEFSGQDFESEPVSSTAVVSTLWSLTDAWTPLPGIPIWLVWVGSRPECYFN